jgi:hypothetical protein
MLDTIVCSEPLIWLFSPAWDAVILTLDIGFFCPFVVIDPTDQGATTVFAPGRMIFKKKVIRETIHRSFVTLFEEEETSTLHAKAFSYLWHHNDRIYGDD